MSKRKQLQGDAVAIWRGFRTIYASSCAPIPTIWGWVANAECSRRHRQQLSRGNYTDTGWHFRRVICLVISNYYCDNTILAHNKVMLFAGASTLSKTSLDQTWSTLSSKVVSFCCCVSAPCVLAFVTFHWATLGPASQRLPAAAITLGTGGSGRASPLWEESPKGTLTFLRPFCSLDCTRPQLWGCCVQWKCKCLRTGPSTATRGPTYCQ